MKNEFIFSEEFGKIDDELVKSAGMEWAGQRFDVFRLYRHKIACAILIVVLGFAMAGNSGVQAAVKEFTTKIGDILGFAKDLSSYTDVINQTQTQNGISLTLKETIVDDRVLMVSVEADFAENGKKPSLWINHEKTTINGKNYTPCRTSVSSEVTVKEETFGLGPNTVLTEVYDEQIVSAGIVNIHLVIEAGETAPLPGQKSDSMAEFVYDFTAAADELATRTVKQNLDISIPVPETVSGVLSLQKLIMNDLYCQIIASGITWDETFSNQYELKLKGTDSYGNPVSLLQENFRSENELGFATDFWGDYEAGQVIDEDDFQMSVPDKDCSYLDLQLYKRKLQWKETILDEDDEYYLTDSVQVIPSEEENYGWEPVGEPFRITITHF